MKIFFATIILWCSINTCFAQTDTIYADRETVYKVDARLGSVFLFAVCNNKDMSMYTSMVNVLNKEFTAAKVRHTSGILDESKGLDSLFAWTDKIRSSTYTIAITINKLYDASSMGNNHAGDTAGKLMNISITKNEKDDGSEVASFSIYINTPKHDAAAGEKAAKLLLDFMRKNSYL